MKMKITTWFPSTALLLLLIFVSYNGTAQQATHLKFDGVDDFVSGSNFALPSGNSPRTLEFWVKMSIDGNSGLRSLVNYGTVDSVSSQRFGILTLSGNLYFVGENYDNNTGVFIADEQWHHIAVTYTGSTITVYKDGKVAGYPLNIALNTSTEIFKIGRRTWDDNQNFKGELDEIRIWNRVVNTSQFQRCSELVGNETGLVLYFKANQGIAGGNNSGLNSLTNIINPANNGILNNFALSGTNSNWVGGSMFNQGLVVFNYPSVLSAYCYNKEIDDIFPSYFGSSNFDYQVSTLAGNGTRAFADGLGTAARFDRPPGVALDTMGNLFVVDQFNNRIRKITPAGQVTTFAGSGAMGYADGNGTAAQFNRPFGIAVDLQCNVYVADYSNHRIRKISPTGQVSTLAGGASSGSTNGQGTTARFSAPTGITVDTAGYVYVVDQFNQRIRKISPTGLVSTLAGSTSGFADGQGTAARFNYPTNIVVDLQGNLYVTDTNNDRIRKISPSGLVTTLVGMGIQGFVNGYSSFAQLTKPLGIALDSLGNLYISESNNNDIRKITALGLVSTLAGGFPGFADGNGTLARFNFPVGLAVNKQGIVYVADQYNSRIRKIALSGTNVGYSITPTLPLGLFINRETGVISGTPQESKPSTNYTISVQTACGNVSTNISFAVLGPADAPLAASNVTQTLSIASSTIFSQNCDNLIARVAPNGAAPIAGNTTAKVWLESTQPLQYVKRHYEITPASNASTATGRITLYFTQDEFNDFNTISILKLPMDAADVANNKTNLRIEKRSGTSNNNTGLPETYTGSIETIDPADADIVWNAAANRWEVSIDVTGFSGFFAKTSLTVLPVKWLYVRGTVNNKKQASLNWRVKENDVALYTIEKNSNNNFIDIGTIAGQGDGEHSYNYTDPVTLNGTAFYRIKQTDIDGRVSYSSVVTLSANENDTKIYPNPVKEMAVISSSSAKLINTKAFIYNVNGKLVMSFIIKSQNMQLSVQDLVPGLYIVKFFDGTNIKMTKL